MTNEQAKQEAIKKAYGRAYHNKIDKNGWAKFTDTKILSIPNESFEQKYIGSVLMIRPNTLHNMESNNGWIRIEPDGSNLPEALDEAELYKVIFKSQHTVQIQIFNFSKVRPVDLECPHCKYWLENITHYKPIKPEEKPIY